MLLLSLIVRTSYEDIFESFTVETSVPAEIQLYKTFIKTDPSEAMNGFLLGIGKYKGYGLSFMTDVLTGVISGGGYGLMPYSDPKKLDVSHSLTAINIEWFMEITEFNKRIDDFVDTLKNLPLRPGFEEILVPGEIENKRVNEKLRSGIPLDNEVIESFNELAANLKIEKLNLN